MEAFDKANPQLYRECTFMTRQFRFMKSNDNITTKEMQSPQNSNPTVNVEYCGACDYSGYCVALGQTIKKTTPNAVILCKRGRQGSFEVEVNDKLVYSKLQTMALPDFNEVAQVVDSISKGVTDSSLCRACLTENETAAHVMVHCPMFAKYIGND